jgi:hypothetical protein
MLVSCRSVYRFDESDVCFEYCEKESTFNLQISSDHLLRCRCVRKSYQRIEKQVIHTRIPYSTLDPRHVELELGHWSLTNRNYYYKYE